MCCVCPPDQCAIDYASLLTVEGDKRAAEAQLRPERGGWVDLDGCVCEAERIESAFVECVCVTVHVCSLIDYSWFSLISCHIRWV